MMMQKRLLIIVFVVAFLLLIPLVAMQFTDEVNWTLGDFVVAGCLLFGAGLILDIIIRKVNKSKYRVVLYVLLLLAFLLVWAELAVGIFGTPFGGD